LPDVGSGVERAVGPRPSDVLASIVIVAAVVGAVLVGSLRRQLAPRPTREQCVALLLRHVELDARARYPSVHAEAVAVHLGAIGGRLEAARDVGACQQRLSAAEVQCALGAPNVDELERCLQ
jgi:hypothetical protein